MRCSSTNGPFLTDLGMCLASPLSAAPHDQPVGTLRLARAAFLLAPRAGRMAPAAGLALAATQRVIDGVHGDAADAWALAPPAIATGLPPRNELVLGVAHFAHRGLAGRVH